MAREIDQTPVIVQKAIILMSDIIASNDSQEACNKAVEWLSKHSSLAGIEP